MVKIFSGDDTDFKGDQRLALTFAAPDVDFSGCTAEVEFLGQKRTFAQVANGGRLTFAFSADETRGMKCGVWPVIIRLRDAAGRVRTVDNTQRIKVTNDVNEAYADAEQVLSVSLLSGGVAMPEIPAELDADATDSVGQFKQKFNALLALLRNVAAVAVMLLFGAFTANAASVATAPINGIPGTASIVTNVNLGGLTTANDVRAIVTNVVERDEWTFSGDVVPGVTYSVGLSGWWYDEDTGEAYDEPGDGRYWEGEITLSGSDGTLGGPEFEWPDATSHTFEVFRYASGEYVSMGTITATRRQVRHNALGLARLDDIPGIVTKEYVEGLGIESGLQEESDPVWSAEKGNYATVGALAAVSNESAVVTRLFTASNVIDEVTNYNSVVRLPSRRLYQLTESNEYVKVWDEMTQHTNTLGKAQTYADNATGTLARAVAPKAWSRVTSGLGMEAPENTTWISTPTTVIAGGLEYAKVIHANGAVWVLSGNGMMNFDPTTNAYLRITADDGTEVFSIEKTDAVTIGADAAGITIDRNVVTIPVPVVSIDHPTMLFRERLNSGDWTDESAFNPMTGGFVNWGGSSGAWVCTIVFDYQPPSSMFFKFQYLREGGTVVRHGAATDLGGGITINGTTYKLGTATINGHTVLTLTP